MTCMMPAPTIQDYASSPRKTYDFDNAFLYADGVFSCRFMLIFLIPYSANYQLVMF